MRRRFDEAVGSAAGGGEPGLEPRERSQLLRNALTWRLSDPESRQALGAVTELASLVERIARLLDHEDPAPGSGPRSPEGASCESGR